VDGGCLMGAEGRITISGRFPEQWVHLGKAWVNSLAVTAILEQNDGTCEVRLGSGESYTSPYSAVDTIFLFRDNSPSEDDLGGG
jgi:hypothetical protein